MKTYPIACLILLLVLCLSSTLSVAADTIIWQGRSGHKMADFQNELYITGGLYAFAKNFFFNDVWTSADGITWRMVSAEKPYSPSRHLHGLVVFQNYLWVMGGQSDTYLNDIWRSADGVSWEKAVAAADWTPRRGMATLVHNAQLFLLGGEDLDREYNSEVWASEDGVAWELLTASPGWRPRWEHAAVSFSNAIFVIGGAADFGKYNDVWRSSDGITWRKVATLPTAVRGHCAAVFKNKIFVFGGVDENDRLLPEVWVSEDGVSWEIVEEYALWPARARHASTVYNKQLWLTGGTTEVGDTADVWQSRDGIDWQEVNAASSCGCACSDGEAKSRNAFWGDMLLIGISLLVLMYSRQ